MSMIGIFEHKICVNILRVLMTSPLFKFKSYSRNVFKTFPSSGDVTALHSKSLRFAFHIVKTKIKFKKQYFACDIMIKRYYDKKEMFIHRYDFKPQT